jgi:RNA polymerase sigma-70 factor (ECF subfamily)
MLNIARNASIDKIRSKGYKESLKNQSFPENVDISTVRTVVAPNVKDVGLKKILSSLKEEQRMLVDLSYFQGYTHEEISQALNIPLGTVKTRIRSALTQLRIMIQ